MSINRNYSQALRKQRGFSLIEVMVTMLVFAIGLLGVASLQTSGIRMVRDGGQIGQAAVLATSMADRMRGNAASDTVVEVDGGELGCNGEEPEEGEEVVEVDCLLDQAEIDDWNDEIEDFLPRGEGTVTTDSGAYLISITWLESEDSNEANNTRTYSLAVQI